VLLAGGVANGTQHGASGYATVDYRPIDRRGEAERGLHYSCDIEPVVVRDGDQSRV